MDLAFSCSALRVPSLRDLPRLPVPEPPAGDGGGEMETFFSDGSFFFRELCRMSPLMPVSFFGGGATGSDAVLALSHNAVSAGSCLAGSRDLLSPEDSVLVGERGPPAADSSPGRGSTCGRKATSKHQ